jgi:feruloyl esterase
MNGLGGAGALARGTLWVGHWVGRPSPASGSGTMPLHEAGSFKDKMTSVSRWILIYSASLLCAAPPPNASCERLAFLHLPETTITLAQSVPAGALTLPPSAMRRGDTDALKELPAFCRVTATLKPSSDSDIKVEVWMPASGWNGRFLGVGNGGWAGRISYESLSAALRDGFATAGTDTGHQGNGNDARFAMGHPEKLIDFGFRAVHEMTVRAKAIIESFYSEGPKFSYWNGCSTGGKQGLTEAQRFSVDYNGIVEGDPANMFTHLMFGTIWPAEVTLKDSASYIPPDKYPLIHRAVLDACDALDGVKDGLIEDPTRCHFDPKVLECKGPDGPGCLTGLQVESARKIYAGPRNPRTGEQIFPGQAPGSELGWTGQAGGPKPMEIPFSYFRYLLFQNPEWDFRTLNFDSDVARADRLHGSILDAADPNLKAFEAHGGKLIMYHGWSDPVIVPLVSVNYYNSVVAGMGGADKTEIFVRLFMVPGMGHCGNGTGPNTFDKVGVIEQWVEHGKAPDEIIASHGSQGAGRMTRPLCPYPKVARWKGSGSTMDAANFACVSN